jgi:hypothetical protein
LFTISICTGTFFKKALFMGIWFRVSIAERITVPLLITGCLFHWQQALRTHLGVKHLLTLNTTSTGIHTIVSLLYVLPFVPVTSVRYKKLSQHIPCTTFTKVGLAL